MNEKRTLHSHGAILKSLRSIWTGKLMRLPAKAASLLLPEVEMNDLEANQRPKNMRAGFDAPVAADLSPRGRCRMERQCTGFLGRMSGSASEAYSTAYL